MEGSTAPEDHRHRWTVSPAANVMQGTCACGASRIFEPYKDEDKMLRMTRDERGKKKIPKTMVY